MTRMRTLIAAVLLTIPMLMASAASPVTQIPMLTVSADSALTQSALVMRDGSLPTPQTGWQCVWIAGYWWCF